MKCDLARQLGQSPPLADEALLPRVLGRGEFNCSYVYLSARDKERHERMVHEGQVHAKKRKQGGIKVLAQVLPLKLTRPLATTARILDATLTSHLHTS